MKRSQMPMVVALWLSLSLPLWSQGKEEWEQLRTSGIIKGLAPGGLVMQTESGETWKVALPRQPKDIQYNASADLDFLRPGLPVQFTAMINNRGQVVSQIAAITVFTPREAADLGIVPEGIAGPNPADALFSDAKEEKKPAKEPTERSCYVGGQIVSLKGKNMLVAAGGMQLKCPLADNVQVKLAIADLSYVQPGDKVEVQARYYANRKDLGAMAGQLTVTAAQPLVDLKKKQKTSN
jgi:hypothetical protein